jgi:copper resistance protein C
MRSFRAFNLAAAAAAIVLAGPAAAHTQVISSTPAAGSTASNVRTVTIMFSEPVMPALSGAEIVMTGMPGMAGHHSPMKVAGARVAASADRKALVATMPRPLPAGAYDINWHAVGADTHRVAGTMSFSVR